MAVRISESTLSPEPRHVRGRLLKLDAHFLQSMECTVNVVHFEVQSYLFEIGNGVDVVDGKCAASLRALEAQVVIAFHNQFQAERSIKRLRVLNVGRSNGYLIQLHKPTLVSQLWNVKHSKNMILSPTLIGCRAAGMYGTSRESGHSFAHQRTHDLAGARDKDVRSTSRLEIPPRTSVSNMSQNQSALEGTSW